MTTPTSIDTTAATSPPRLPLDADALLRYARARVRAFPRDANVELRVTQFGHGQSNPTYKVECVRVDDARTTKRPPRVLATYVLRKKPPGALLRSAHAVEREFAVQRALSSRAARRVAVVPVPAMIASCDDASVLGTPFYLMSHVRGHVFVTPGLERLPSAAHRATVYRDMARILGGLHRIDPSAVSLRDFAGGGGARRESDARTYSARQLRRWTRQYDESCRDGGDAEREPCMRELIRWLSANVPKDEPGGRLTHGDYRLDNLVFKRADGGGGCVAVLDWELSTLGCPYGDIAYNCIPYHLPRTRPGRVNASYPAFEEGPLPDGIPTEAEHVRAWSEASGLPNPMTSGTWPFYVALSLFRAAAILAGVRRRAREGNASSANAAAAGALVETLAKRALLVAGVPEPAAAAAAVDDLAQSRVGFPGRSSIASASASASTVRAPVGFEPSERAAKLLVSLRRFMREHVYPNEAAFEAHAASAERWTVPSMTEELKTLAQRAGLWNLWLPVDSLELMKIGGGGGGALDEGGKKLSESELSLLTGPGLTNLEYAHLASEMGASVWASEFFNCSAPDTGNMEVLLRYGTASQQTRWLAPLLRGEIRSCFAMTEPEVASSDATNIRSRVVRDGDEYVLNGRKWWTSGACDPRCEVAIFMGKTTTDEDAAKANVPKHRQQSMVLVPMRAKGVEVVRPLSVFGYDDAPHGHAETTFRDVRVRVEDAILLGEGRGFEIAQGRLGPGRLHHCMRLIGMGERALRLASRRAAERVAFGKPLAANGSTLQTLGACRVRLDGARLTTLEAARMLDAEGNKRAKGAIAACKIAAPKAALAVIDAAIQIHGGLGVCEDTPLARMFAGARTLRLADGPDEVHLETVARIEVRNAKL